MKLNLSNEHDKKKFLTYANKLIVQRANVEIKEVKNNRTVKQNSYLHVLFNLFAIEFGYTSAEAKTFLKRESNQLVYEKNGIKFLRSTSDLDTKEMTEFIEWLRNYSSNNGLYLPTSEEYITQRFEIDKEIEKFKDYL